MKKYYILLILASVLLSGCDCLWNLSCNKNINGNGNLITFEYQFEPFQSLSIDHGLEFRIINTHSTYKADITLDENLEKYLEVEQSGEDVRIRMETNNSYVFTDFYGDIYTDALFELKMSGGSYAGLREFTTLQELDISISGGSKVESFNEIQFFTIIYSGSGGSVVDFRTSSAENVTVHLSGGSKLHIHINDGGELTGGLSGGSVVYYSGNNIAVDVSTSGGSRVIKMD